MDGGCENNNIEVDTYINQETISIEKIIAQIEIPFSNSAIEAVNKVIKHRYLFFQDIHNFDELVKYLDKAILDYNNKCPHIGLKGLTPLEMLEEKVLDKGKFKTQMERTIQMRVEENKKVNCGLC